MTLNLKKLARQPVGTVWFEIWDDRYLGKPRVSEFHVEPRCHPAGGHIDVADRDECRLGNVLALANHPRHEVTVLEDMRS